MTIEQLWSLEYISGLSSESGGVVVLEKGKIIGGDNNYFYIGSYELKDSKFSATIDVKHYSKKYNSLFGKREELIIKLDGNYNDEEMLLTGHMLEDPSIEIHVRLKYHAYIFQKLKSS